MQRDPAAPPDLDGYTAVRVLGVGGFSDVFLYEQELPRRRVAVKVLSGRLTDAVRAAFVRETNLMAALSSHPYIVTIHQAGIAGDGRPYLVMEYCSQPSLAERSKQQPLSIADALRTGIRIAGAVATLHGAGILHRDIKPANVLTNDYGWPALTDFGIATSFGESAGDTMGLSVPWSPPEMFVELPDPDVRSDVFSLAATLYTALSGRTPFEVRGGPNGQLDLMGRIERGEATPMTRDDLPASLQAALARGVAPRREDRWQSALDLAHALRRIELELGYPPTGIEVPGIGMTGIEVPGIGMTGIGMPVVGDPKREEAAARPRSAATIAAQPAPGPALPFTAAPAPVSARPVPPAASIRQASAERMPLAASQPTEPPLPPSAWTSPWPEVRRRRRRGLVVGLVSCALAVLAAAAIVIAILFGARS